VSGKEHTGERLMRLLDAASDFVADDASWHAEVEELDTENLRLDYLRSIAAGLGAIAFLLARQDKEAWNEWSRY
jgi:hypothetical protein